VRQQNGCNSCVALSDQKMEVEWLERDESEKLSILNHLCFSPCGVYVFRLFRGTKAVLGACKALKVLKTKVLKRLASAFNRSTDKPAVFGFQRRKMVLDGGAVGLRVGS